VALAVGGGILQHLDRPLLSNDHQHHVIPNISIKELGIIQGPVFSISSGPVIPMKAGKCSA
jgi:hypothetical protein